MLRLPTPKQLSLEYGVYGSREPPTHLKGTIPPVQPEWIDERVHEGLAKMSLTKTLALKRSGFGDRQAKLLLELLSDLAKPCPRTMLLDHNQLTDTGVAHLIELLERRPELVEVELYHEEDGRAAGAPGVGATMAMRLKAAAAANAAADEKLRQREADELDAKLTKELAETPGWRWPEVTSAGVISDYCRRTVASHPTVPELKQQLKALGKPVGGKAAELVERLRAARAVRGTPLPEPYTLSKKGGSHGSHERLRATRPSDWKACACDEYEAAVAAERLSSRAPADAPWWSGTGARYVVSGYANFLSEHVDVPGSHGDPAAWAAAGEGGMPAAMVWHRRAEMLYVEWPKQSQLHHRKQYNQIYEAHCAAFAERDKPPTPTPPTHAAPVPARTGGSATPAPAAAPTEALATPASAAVGTAVVAAAASAELKTAATSKKRTIDDFFRGRDV